MLRIVFKGGVGLTGGFKVTDRLHRGSGFIRPHGAHAHAHAHSVRVTTDQMNQGYIRPIEEDRHRRKAANMTGNSMRMTEKVVTTPECDLTS